MNEENFDPRPEGVGIVLLIVFATGIAIGTSCMIILNAVLWPN